MLKLRKIAITGNVASGKSLVCSFLKDQGVYLVSADTLVHQLLATHKECIERVAKLLGEEVKVNHQIDREKVSKIVFSNPKKLKDLENILYPFVFKEIEERYEKLVAEHTNGLFVVEVPLLFEAGWQSFFDFTIAVTAQKELCLARYLQKGKTAEDYEQRVKRQFSDEQKESLADFVIKNNGSKEKLRELTSQILNELKTR